MTATALGMEPRTGWAVFAFGVATIVGFSVAYHWEQARVAGEDPLVSLTTLHSLPSTQVPLHTITPTPHPHNICLHLHFHTTRPWTSRHVLSGLGRRKPPEKVPPRNNNAILEVNNTLFWPILSYS